MMSKRIPKWEIQVGNPKDPNRREGTHLHHHRPFVTSNGQLVRPGGAAHGPCPLQPVVQGRLQAVGRHLPDFDGFILASRDNERKLCNMEAMSELDGNQKKGGIMG